MNGTSTWDTLEGIKDRSTGNPRWMGSWTKAWATLDGDDSSMLGKPWMGSCWTEADVIWVTCAEVARRGRKQEDTRVPRKRCNGRRKTHGNPNLRSDV